MNWRVLTPRSKSAKLALSGLLLLGALGAGCPKDGTSGNGSCADQGGDAKSGQGCVISDARCDGHKGRVAGWHDTWQVCIGDPPRWRESDANGNPK